MHAATLEKSKRLQKIMKILKDHKPHSSMELIRRAHTVAIATDISELRHNNVPVRCDRVGRVYYYRLEDK